MEKKQQRLFTRRNFISTGVIGAASSYLYARYFEPTMLSVTHKDIHIHRLPPALDGLVVVQLTDLHYDPLQHDEMLAELVNTTNAANPDIIALTGDYIVGQQAVFHPLMEYLSGLKAKHGIYAVLGNHDGWHGKLSHFKKGFLKAGHEFLLNQGTRIRVRGENLYIVGTDSIWSGEVDAQACYRGYVNGSEETVIALVHEPDVFDSLVEEYPVSLQLSGHTHGGQCRVPLIGYAPVKVRYGKRYIYGEYTRGKSKIFVSRGIGTVGIPVRFACRPEVAVLTLRSKPIQG